LYYGSAEFIFAVPVTRDAGCKNNKEWAVEPIAIVTVVVLVQYLLFGYHVSRARIKHGVRAPAISGHPEFERTFRIHQNTLEQLVLFVPALWMFGSYVHPLTGAAIGLVFPVGREVYRRSYAADPSSRAAGAAIGGVAIMVLLLGAAIGALVSWI
jgi:glutathione S-transferase